MRISWLIWFLTLALVGCKTPAAPETSLKDAGITTSAPRDQGGTAFCWSYALVAHIEQRYYELTRGKDKGGFRLNLSEEYLGLIHLTEQLIAGKVVDEGLQLSETLALIDKYGLIPEKIGDRTLFRAAFDNALGQDVTDKANEQWFDLSLPENAPLPPDVALKVVADVADLSPEQVTFLSAAMGITNEADAHFRFGNRDYTPRTFVKERLKFNAADYFVLNLPDSGRGASGEASYSKQYLQTLGVIKKAMLYGYSVPVSFNFVTGSEAAGGTLSCTTKHCADAEIAVPTSDWPHANHAVLLIDYRTEHSGFTPVTAETLRQSMESTPSEWVFKNSWGFNHNASANPELLKRFPLPAYTTMSQDFFEASHWLRPGRFEAIVPRQVCIKHACSALIGGAEAVDLQLDEALLLANIHQLARDPVEFDEHAKTLGDDQLKVDLQISEAEICALLEVSSDVKYVAVFVTPDGGKTETVPRFVLSSEGKWKHCEPMREGPKTFGLVFEPLNDHYKVLGQVRRSVP